MILVTLGTQDKPFGRLLEKISEQIDNGKIKDRVVVQSGCTRFETDKMEMFDLIPMDEMESLTKEADLIITHGGVGSIIGGLKNNKKVIACARLKKYGEHTNDHQIQIIENFSKAGYIKALEEDGDLGKILEEIADFVPEQYESNTEKMIALVDGYIKNNVK